MWLLLSIIVLWVLPGFALLSALFPTSKHINFWQKLSFTVPSSIIVSCLAGLILSKFFLLTPVWITSTIFSFTLLLFTIAFLRGYRFNFKNIYLISWIKEEWYSVIVIAFCSLILLSAFFYHPLSAGYSTIGYLYDASQIAKSHGIPDSFREWNSLQPVVVNKILFEIFTAEFLLVTRADPLVVGRIAMVLSSSATIFAAFAFFRLFFSSFVSASLLSFLFFLPLLKICLIAKISKLCGEGFAYSPMFFLFWLGWKGIYSKDNQKKWLALFLLPIINFIHGVPGLISAFFLMSISFTGLIFKHKNLKKGSFFLVLIPVIFFLGSEGLISLTGKKLLYEDVMKGKQYLPFSGEDPTWLFHHLLNENSSKRYIKATGPYQDTKTSLLKLGASFLMVHPGKLPRFIPVVGILNEIVLIFLSVGIFLFIYIYPPLDSLRVRYSLLTWVFFSLAIIILAFAFLWLYSTYLPAIHVFRREIRFIGFLPLFLWGFLFSWAEKLIEESSQTTGRFVRQNKYSLFWILLGAFLLLVVINFFSYPMSAKHAYMALGGFIISVTVLILLQSTTLYNNVDFKMNALFGLAFGLFLLIVSIFITPSFLTPFSPDRALGPKTITRINNLRLLAMVTGTLIGIYSILILRRPSIVQVLQRFFNNQTKKISTNQLIHIIKTSVIILLVLLSGICEFGWLEKPGLSKDGLNALRWLKGEVPPSFSVLTNQRTTGAIGLIAEASGLIEGRAPYLQPELLYDALEKMKQVRSFFTLGGDNEFLDKEKVAYVIAAPNGELGGQDVTQGKYKLSLLFSNKRLKLKKIFGSVVVYEVDIMSSASLTK